MRIDWVILIVVIIVGLAWKSGVKLPKLGGNAVGQWFKNITGNLGWLFAIAGQAFCLILIWQCFPEFFGHWLNTNGFWFIQLGFLVSVILLKYAKPQVVGVVALLLTLTCLLVSMVSAGRMLPSVVAQKEPLVRTTNPTRNWPPVIEKKESVIAWVDKWSETRSLPFGKGFFVQLEGGMVFGKKNDRPLKDSRGSLLVINQENQVDAFGNSCERFSFKSATNKPVVVTIYYYDALVYK